MTRARSTKFALGIAAASALGLAVGIHGLQSERVPIRAGTYTREAGPDPKETAEGAHGLSVEQLKELMARWHPGMEVPEEVEVRIDVTKLPLPERRERMKRAIAAHLREAWDGDWAAVTEDRLSAEFAMLASVSAFEVHKAECRASSCLVTVQWLDEELGQDVYTSILSTPLGLGCRLEMLPPEQRERAATVYLDCARARKAAERAAPMVAMRNGAVPTIPPGSTGPHGVAP
jgi:hypothetical protein